MSSEIRTHVDPVTGVEVTQLTDYKGHSHHFYFTNSGWHDAGRRLLVSSDRNNRTNLFSIRLSDGDIEQLTDLEPVPLPREVEFLRACVNPVREEAYFWHDRSLIALDLTTKKQRVLAEIEPKWCISMINCSADGKNLYFGLWEDLSHQFKVDLLRGYVGFRETWAAHPLSQVVEVPTAGGPLRAVWEEREWIGHVNTSPTKPNWLTYCHEGPWHNVQRIWGLDVTTGKRWPIRKTQAGEAIGHEYWYADGVRLGYHGNIDGQQIIGRVNFDDTGRHEEAFPGQTGHTFSCDEKLIVGDGGGVIRLWKWDGQRYLPPRVLCRHDSSSRIQQTHPHPRISPDGTYVVFTSDRSGYGNVYRVPLVEFERLPLADG